MRGFAYYNNGLTHLLVVKGVYYNSMDELNFDNEMFEIVWNRVTLETSQTDPEIVPQSPPAPAKEIESDRLRRFMDMTAQNEHCTRTAAAQCCGCRARPLIAIAEDDRIQLRKLRAMYFILTGDTYDPIIAPESSLTTSERLRSLYSRAVDSGAEFISAAELTERADFADTYRNFGLAKQRHAETISDMIERMIG